MGVICKPYYIVLNTESWKGSQEGFSDKGQPHTHAERFAMSFLEQTLEYHKVKTHTATVLLVQNAFPCMDGCHGWLSQRSLHYRYIYVRVDDDQGDYSAGHLGNGLVKKPGESLTPRVIYYTGGVAKYLKASTAKALVNIPDIWAAKAGKGR